MKRFKDLTRASSMLALAALLAGCSGVLTNISETGGVRSPGFFFGESDALRFSGGSTASLRPITEADLVGPQGQCALPESVTTASAQANDASADPNAPPTQTAPLNPGGIALQMTECEVVYRAGAVEKIDIGANERNERSVTLTYLRGPWPGIYRFTDGRLAQIDRVVVPEEPRAKKKAPPKKKRA